MALRITVDPTVTKGLGSVAATDALGPGAEPAQPDGELAATAPATAQAASPLTGLLIAIGVGLVVGYIFSNDEKEKE